MISGGDKLLPAVGGTSLPGGPGLELENRPGRFGPWAESLLGTAAQLELPTDFPRPPARGHRRDSRDFTIEQGVCDRFAELCRAEGLSLSSGLLAVLDALLYRYTQAENISAGLVIRDAELNSGVATEVMIIKASLAGTLPFKHHHRQIAQAERLAGLSEANAPPEGFHVGLAFTDAGRAAVDPSAAGGGEESHFSACDLSVEILRGSRLFCRIHYDPHLFLPSTIDRMAGHYRTLVAAAAQEPATPIALMNMLTDKERQQVLFEWNATWADYDSSQPLIRAFEEQAQRYPDAIAVVEGQRRVTFRELDRIAAQIAVALAACDVGPERPVGVYLSRSINTFAAVLGAMKAGAPFVPLDISQPPSRLSGLIEQAGCAVILTTAGRGGNLPAEAAVVTLDEDSPVWALDPADAPSVSPGQAAYIIFTSGSTGVPKGVVGSHRATINRFEWMYRTYPFAEGEVCCQKTSLGFVDSIWEMLGPLLAGVPNVIIAEDLVTDPALLVDLLARERVSRIVLVPTLLRVLLNSFPDLASRLPQLKLWTVSGEYLPADLARRFREQFPDALLLNIYGSSEVAADVTCYEVSDLQGLQSIPIGRPIANSQVYVLDPFSQPVPIGVPGTIHVGGDGLSLGYWHRPDLTAERFVANPLPGTPSKVLFNMGDRGRLLADGNLEYLGRNDHQTKIRGVRIELGEVEANLIAHPDVQDAVVAAFLPDGEVAELVAYIVGEQGIAPSSVELRAFLSERVPSYMIPLLFIELEALPLLPSGKVDRRSLPNPALSRASDTEPGDNKARAEATPHGGGRATHDEAEASVEAVLARLWAQVLKQRVRSSTASFFDLGGHSLLAIRLAADVNRHFGRQIPVADLFREPTIAGMARYLRSESPAPSAMDAIQPEGRRPPFFAGGSSREYRDLSEALGIDQPFYRMDVHGLQERRLLAGEPLYGSVEEIAARFLQDVKSVQPEGPYYLGGQCDGGIVALEMALQLQQSGERVALLAQFDTAVGGDFVKLPLHQRLWYLLRSGKLPSRMRDRLQPFTGAMRGRTEAERRHNFVWNEIWKAIWQYRPRRAFDGEIQLFRARETYGVFEDVSIGWEPRATKGVRIHDVPGNHFLFFQHPEAQAHVKRVIEQSDDDLVRAIG